MDNTAGHSEFMERFVPNQRRIFGFVLTIVSNLNEADEVFQETSLILWQKYAEFDPQRDFVRWACGVAVNVIRNRRRKQSTDRHIFSDTLLDRITEVRTANQHWLEERVTALAQCLKRLSQTQRDLLQLFYGGERSVAELAAGEGISELALRQRMRRIRRRLFDCVNYFVDGTGSL